MKWLLSLILLLLCISVYAQNSNDTTDSKVFTVTTNTLDRQSELRKNWTFKGGDDPTRKMPDYDDNAWQPVLTSDLNVYNDKDKHIDFRGIGWFRYHFSIDSAAINNKPIALRILQGGASEIFLDGKLIQQFGIINGKDSTEQYNPGNRPFLLPVSPGEHVIAIRYANYITDRMYRYDESAGFTMRIGYLDDAIYDFNNDTESSTFIMMVLMGVFAALSFVHLLLYLYRRSEKTNLYFSIFMASLAGFFIFLFTNIMSNDVSRQLMAIDALMVCCTFASFSISGFSNELFSKNKLRFKIITAISFGCLVWWILLKKTAYTGYFILMIAVLIEITILSIRGIYKKIPGSKIIGSGIAYFALFLLISVLALTMGHLSFYGDTIGFAIYGILMILATLSIPASISIHLAWTFARTNKNLAVQLHQVQELSQKTLEQEQERKRILENKQEELEQEVAIRTAEVRKQKEEIEQQHTALKTEKKKSDDLLLNILPEEIAEELKNKGTSEAKYFDQVSVLFTDFVDFTKAGERMTPQELVDELHTCFKAFDEICSKYNIEKIKTIGDAYLAVCGLPIADPDHAINVTRAAIEIRQFIAVRKQAMSDKSFNIRIGIHSGSVVAGIVGVKKFAYDIWGDTVNTAARMEQSSEAGKINISESTYQLVKDNFNCTFRGQISAKNKGEMNMYFVEAEK